MKVPPLTPVKSTGIAAIGHDPLDSRVYVQFTDGAIHSYGGVSAEDFQEFSSSPSKGSFLHQRWRKKPSVRH